MRQHKSNTIDMHTTGMKKQGTRTTGPRMSGRASAKERITVSLSKERVRFLKAHSGRRGAPSVSAYVERLVADDQARAELEELSAHTALYYDSLSTKEAEEQNAWGELSEAALAVKME